VPTLLTALGEVTATGLRASWVIEVGCSWVPVGGLMTLGVPLECRELSRTGTDREDRNGYVSSSTTMV
jgi:hypothetical protein